MLVYREGRGKVESTGRGQSDNIAFTLPELAQIDERERTVCIRRGTIIY